MASISRTWSAASLMASVLIVGLSVGYADTARHPVMQHKTQATPHQRPSQPQSLEDAFLIAVQPFVKKETQTHILISYSKKTEDGILEHYEIGRSIHTSYDIDRTNSVVAPFTGEYVLTYTRSWQCNQWTDDDQTYLDQEQAEAASNGWPPPINDRAGSIVLMPCPDRTCTVTLHFSYQHGKWVYEGLETDD